MAVSAKEEPENIWRVEGEYTMDIEIGKFTLESLTTGMYSEPESCYREYIQNAVDSLDTALTEKLLQEHEFRIEIIVDGSRQEIGIKDNGTGIKKVLVRKALLDIGNSTKLHTTNRGFRGIGRLGGLSYCKKLSFCTTATGESEKTLITFDCDKLKELLVPGQNTEHNLQSVIEAVTEVRVMQEQASTHYFIVKMEGVDDISSLLDLDEVKDYIMQVAPIPFRNRFIWANEIKSHLSENGIPISEYPVFIGESYESLSQVFKPYKQRFEVNSRTGVSTDEILGMSFFCINDNTQQLMAYGWYADTEFSGTLVDERLAGIRMRQGNILIGDRDTLKPYYKEPRFNGWAVGEIYVVSQNLIPNARRDDFEKNNAYTDFSIELKSTICTEITDKIRTASKVRNNPVQKVLKKATRDVSKVEDVLSSGFHSAAEKEQVASGLAATRRDLYVIPKNAPSEAIEQKTALMEKLASLVTEVEESTNFRVKKDVPTNFSKAEKKVAQAWLEVLTRNFERTTVDSLYREFLVEIQSGGKK